ncbi:MAG: hypothetical protein ALECFALPRED_000474 [Alectoria fallacina]|uniref:Nucleoside phosphorylase domain-containing protein n=1 Tax=Alectoria fallacina TaxID=1903189 RepID=A0A8H3IJR2_9LECA|nr:MAG: hypothetical protein ALECFALPRED_000474 [Alectoria fallacina]
MDELPQYSNQDYIVGWLCALPRSELTAARMMLDRPHKEPVNQNADDENSYFFGDINGHNIVITCMPPEETGTLSAQKLVQPLKRSFPNMVLHLFVGIGGGIPRNPPTKDSNDDIHLGDVVVGWAEQAGIPAVVQYDHGRYHNEGRVELLSMLDKPNRRLLNALAPIISDREMGQMNFHDHLHRLSDLQNFQHPGLESDTLFEAGYDHVAVDKDALVEADKPHCYRCNPTYIVKRPLRETIYPQFHRGTILSGDLVMRDARKRDQLSKLHHNAVCIEMEAAGVIEDTHCLVVRGIADYADSHKYWSWQNYAAASAAAFARELLHKIRPVVAVSDGSGLNGLVTAEPTLKFDRTVFYNILNQGEQHYRKPRRESITESLSAALACFSQADAMLQESGNDDPALQIKVYFRLMTVECTINFSQTSSPSHVKYANLIAGAQLVQLQFGASGHPPVGWPGEQHG